MCSKSVPNALVAENEGSVDLTSSAELCLGQQTRTFLRNKTPDLDRLSFSVQWGVEPDQTLDLVATDQNDFNIWTMGLRALLDKIRASTASELHMMDGTGSCCERGETLWFNESFCLQNCVV